MGTRALRIVAWSGKALSMAVAVSAVIIAVRFISGFASDGLGFGVFVALVVLIAGLVPFIVGRSVQETADSRISAIVWLVCGVVGFGVLCVITLAAVTTI